jgi:hypothetical protein
VSFFCCQRSAVTLVKLHFIFGCKKLAGFFNMPRYTLSTMILQIIGFLKILLTDLYRIRQSEFLDQFSFCYKLKARAGIGKSGFQLYHYKKIKKEENMKKLMSLNLQDEEVVATNLEDAPFCLKLAAKLSISEGSRSGEVELSTRYRMHHAYVWQIAVDPLPDETNGDPDQGWKHIAVTSRASYKIENLEAGKKYWFRVASIGKNGRNPWSEPLNKTIAE